MSSYRPPERRLYKSRTNRKIAGVCGGIAEFFGLDPALIRLAFVVLLILGGGGGLIYLIAALILDDNPYE
jgi:phage shock protein C